MYTYVQMKKGSPEHTECLKEQMLSYYKELDEQHGRKTAEDFLLSVIESTLAMQGPHDRHLEIGFAEGEAVGFLYGKVDHEGHKGFIKPGWGYIMEFYGPSAPSSTGHRSGDVSADGRLFCPPRCQ